MSGFSGEDIKRIEDVVDRTMKANLKTLNATLDPMSRDLYAMRNDYYGKDGNNGTRSEVKKNTSFRRRFYAGFSAVGITAVGAYLTNIFRGGT